MARVTFIHTNDLHGSLTPAKLPQLAVLRSESDLYFDAGDSIRAGNLAIPMSADPVWPMFSSLDLTASVPGNRETHVLASVIQTKFSGATHPILCSNWRNRDGSLVWDDELILERNGLNIGLFGVMVPMVTSRMKTQSLSAYLWDQPLEVAVRRARELRSRVDLLIALTHIGQTQDRRLADMSPEIDVILGGHSHNILEKPEMVNGVAICQGGSHARYIGRYAWESGVGLTGAELIPWT